MSFENWNGYNLERLTVAGREAVIVCPQDGTANGKWALKTEYFGAFPDTEIKLLEKGYHIAHITNISRWYVDEDNEARYELAKYMHEQKGLSQKCVIVGMSCGGMQGIYFAAKYPECVSCMYLDAPVVNYLSIPAFLGKNAGSEYAQSMFEEFFEAKHITVSELLSYRNHPQDRIDELVSHNIPVVLVSGDADTVVCFEENGLLLKEAYEKAGVPIETYIKQGGDHHPHGLFDNTPIVEFLTKYDM